jgi:sulfate adenylyltransferase subunit 1
MKIDKNQLLRFTTAGSVDDGKSTLIGRLLYDSKSIFEDQLAAVKNSSKQKGIEGVDLAMFTDGLKDEREQGITIDVAYRYFTAKIYYRRYPRSHPVYKKYGDWRIYSKCSCCPY